MDRPSRTDPLAVALGNASLLGVGYLLLGRRRLAVIAAAVTVVLLALTVAVAAVWCEIVVLVWWVAVIAHGRLVASGRANRATVGRHRLIALAVTIPVVLVVGFLRFDTARIERSVAEARDGGSCPSVLTAQDRAWFGDRIADAPLAARGDAAVRTCHRLDAAKAKLSTALKGDTVKVYELRTGKRVADRKVQVSGSSCPTVISTTTYSGLGDGYPDPDRYVDESTSDVRDAFRSLVIR